MSSWTSSLGFSRFCGTYIAQFILFDTEGRIEQIGLGHKEIIRRCCAEIEPDSNFNKTHPQIYLKIFHFLTPLVQTYSNSEIIV